MSKLFFKYGVMGSAKSLELIRGNYAFHEKGMKTLVFKPELDTREGKTKCMINSKAGLSLDAEFIPTDDKHYISFLLKLREQLILENNDNKTRAIFIDEAQFLSAQQVEDFQKIVFDFDIPVLCYGLKNNFRGELFEGSKRLLELADDIQEIIGICHCGRKARQNARIVNVVHQKKGEEVLMGNTSPDDIYYVALCNRCFFSSKLS